MRASGEGAGRDLVFRIVGSEADDSEQATIFAHNQRLRWTRHRILSRGDHSWILRAAVDLQVTHLDDFLENAVTALDPIFDGWSLGPVPEPAPLR